MIQQTITQQETEAERRQRREQYWIGFDLCCDGRPLAACRNEDQRRGWRGAIKASGFDGMSAEALNRMGV